MAFETFAYIDPFSGTILLQLIFAGVAGTVLFFRRSVYRICSLVWRRKPEGEEESQ